MKWLNRIEGCVTCQKIRIGKKKEGVYEERKKKIKYENSKEYLTEGKKIDKYEEKENEISMRISKYVGKKQKGMSITE